jgi:putative acetyltransferase
VNERAFGQPAEASLVDRLRDNCPTALSLVADDNGIVGHILFTPVIVEAPDRKVVGMGLAPMAVEPAWQRQGIGTALVTHGLAALRERECPFVVVVGHPEYYPRFGFEPASAHLLRSQWDGIRDEAFMVLVLDTRAMDGVSGIARYRSEFDEAT